MPLGDRKNSLFAGSTVTHGRAKALVVTTGMDTSVGQLALDVLAGETGEPPLLARMGRFTRVVAVAVLLFAAIWFGRANLAALAVLLAPGVVLVLVRRYSPAQAFGFGALASYAIFVVISLLFTVVRALLSDYERPEELCWGCAENAAEIPGAAIFILLFTIPVGVAGGVFSAIASLAFVRTTESAHS